MIDLFLQIDDFDPREFEGCSPQEIAELMKIYNYSGAVPSSLYDFLVFGGHRMADMRPLSEFYYESMIYMKRKFVNGVNSKFAVLKQNPIPPDGLLFCGSEGYYYEFIVLSEGDDPKVYAFDDDPELDNFNIEDERFSNTINTFITQYLKIHAARIAGKEELRKQVNDLKKNLLDAKQLVENMRTHTADHSLEQLLQSYTAIVRGIYNLYDSPAHISFNSSLNNAKIIESIKVDSPDKQRLLELDEISTHQFNKIKKMTG